MPLTTVTWDVATLADGTWADTGLGDVAAGDVVAVIGVATNGGATISVGAHSIPRLFSGVSVFPDREFYWSVFNGPIVGTDAVSVAFDSEFSGAVAKLVGDVPMAFTEGSDLQSTSGQVTFTETFNLAVAGLFGSFNDGGGSGTYEFVTSGTAWELDANCVGEQEFFGYGVAWAELTAKPAGGWGVGSRFGGSGFSVG